MKKFIAVLLATIMLFSCMAVGFAVVAESGDAVVAAETPVDEGSGDAGSDSNELPSWFTELMARLQQVFLKLLIKLGLKIIF